MNQQPLDLLSEDDRKELELLFSIIHSETLSTAARLEEVARLLAKHGLLIPPLSPSKHGAPPNWPQS